MTIPAGATMLAALALPISTAAAATCNTSTSSGFATDLANASCSEIDLAAGTYSTSAATTGFNATRTVSVVGAGSSSTTLNRSGGTGSVITSGINGNLALSDVTIT